MIMFFPQSLIEISLKSHCFPIFKAIQRDFSAKAFFG